MIYIIKRRFRYLLAIIDCEPHYGTRWQSFDRCGNYLGLKFKDGETTRLIAKCCKGRVVKL